MELSARKLADHGLEGSQDLSVGWGGADLGLLLGTIYVSNVEVLGVTDFSDGWLPPVKTGRRCLPLVRALPRIKRRPRAAADRRGLVFLVPGPAAVGTGIVDPLTGQC